jgi:hypothetical protein
MHTEKTIIALYLSLLALHAAHVFEEVWGRFWLINQVFGLGWFLAANWFLFCIPLVLFYFYLAGKRWSLRLSIVYAGVMIFNGFVHNIATLITKRYFDGFAGGYTGIGLIVTGISLLYFLLRKKRFPPEE